MKMESEKLKTAYGVSFFSPTLKYTTILKGVGNEVNKATPAVIAGVAVRQAQLTVRLFHVEGQSCRDSSLRHFLKGLFSFAPAPSLRRRNGPHQFQNACRGQRLLRDLDAERVRDCIDDRRRCTDRPAFSYTAEVDRADRRRLQMLNLDRRDLHRRWNQVVHERQCQELGVLIVDGVLVQHAANALSRSAAHLPFDHSRIDHRAAVLDDEIARNVYLARLRIDLDPAAMGGLRPPTLATII